MIVMLFTHSVGNERGQYAPVVTLNLFQGLNNMMDTETTSLVGDPPTKTSLRLPKFSPALPWKTSAVNVSTKVLPLKVLRLPLHDQFEHPDTCFLKKVF
jgi:hypothetical protein